MSKNSLAIAYSTKRAAMKKARGVSSQDKDSAMQSPKSPMITADEQAKAKEMLNHEHTADCFAIGGVVGGQAPSCGYARGVSEQDQTLAYGGSIYDRVKEKRMPKDPADLDEDEYPSESYSELNEGAVGKNYDAEQAGEQPMDSNEDGDDLMDADEHGKSMFKKIKLKRSQPGDRGKY